MKAYGEPVPVDKLPRLNEYGADDLFICCASFEDRCLSGALKVGPGFRVRYSVIFVIEEPFYTKEVDTNLFKLQSSSAGTLPRASTSFAASAIIRRRLSAS